MVMVMVRVMVIVIANVRRFKNKKGLQTGTNIHRVHSADTTRCQVDRTSGLSI